MRDVCFGKIELSVLEYLRDMQINELKGPVQDSIEEGIITYNADFIKISIEEETIGYICIGTYGHYKYNILEYYIISKYRAISGDIIELLARHYKCKGWLVNTRDFFAFPKWK